VEKVYTRDENVFACTGCSASHRQNHQNQSKNLLQNGMLHMLHVTLIVFKISLEISVRNRG